MTLENYNAITVSNIGLNTGSVCPLWLDSDPANPGRTACPPHPAANRRYAINISIKAKWLKAPSITKMCQISWKSHWATAGVKITTGILRAKPF
jgi:hypothetical protein